MSLYLQSNVEEVTSFLQYSDLPLLKHDLQKKKVVTVHAYLSNTMRFACEIAIYRVDTCCYTLHSLSLRSILICELADMMMKS